MTTKTKTRPTFSERAHLAHLLTDHGVQVLADRETGGFLIPPSSIPALLDALRTPGPARDSPEHDRVCRMLLGLKE